MIYDHNFICTKRRYDQVCPSEPRRTELAGRHYHYLSPMLKKNIFSWLLDLTYEEAEELLSFTSLLAIVSY